MAGVNVILVDMGHRVSAFFWRWSPEFLMDIRDGVLPWISGPLPSHKANQKLVKDPVV